MLTECQKLYYELLVYLRKSKRATLTVWLLSSFLIAAPILIPKIHHCLTFGEKNNTGRTTQRITLRKWNNMIKRKWKSRRDRRSTPYPSFKNVSFSFLFKTYDFKSLSSEVILVLTFDRKKKKKKLKYKSATGKKSWQ